MLTGTEIYSRIVNGDIVISPFNTKHVNPNSYDVRLDIDSLLVVDNSVELDSRMDCSQHFKPVEVDDEGFVVIQPNKLYLACTVEYTETKNLIPMIVGRSSLARLGVSVHQTAGFGDIGFNGYWTLEITCTNPTKLYRNQRIGQLYYLTPTGNQDIKYLGKYVNNNGVQASMMYKDYEA